MHDAHFVSSFASVSALPSDGRSEVAFIGRSNVGKSSLINGLTKRKGLAKTSATPGKTQLLNYFLVNNSFYLVDMPGYGYAKTAKEKRLEWARLTEHYFRTRTELRCVVVLVDSRHPLLESDRMVIDWLSESDVPFVVALTKIDKLKQADIAKHAKLLANYLQSHHTIFRTSSETGRGMAELREFISLQASSDSRLQSSSSVLAEVRSLTDLC